MHPFSKFIGLLVNMAATISGCGFLFGTLYLAVLSWISGNPDAPVQTAAILAVTIIFWLSQLWSINFKGRQGTELSVRSSDWVGMLVPAILGTLVGVGLHFTVGFPTVIEEVPFVSGLGLVWMFSWSLAIIFDTFIWRRYWEQYYDQVPAR